MRFSVILAAFCSFIPVCMAAPCAIEDRACVVQNLLETSKGIEDPNWRDQTLREIAKTMAADRRTDEAIALVPAITNPDTKALTIRGIGMAAAKNALGKEAYDTVFQALRAEAEKIDHPPSYAIALTYIAMAQAFAGDDTGAWKTASEMENAALRHKAYGETAEIQAELGKFDAAMQSIEYIDSASFRDKAYSTVSGILANEDRLQNAYDAADKIGNAYKKAQAIQYVLDTQVKDDDEDKDKDQGGDTE